MAKGLDELIDWLVAETAYCGEAGKPVVLLVLPLLCDPVSNLYTRSVRCRLCCGRGPFL